MEFTRGKTIQPGSFVELRGRPWLVEGVEGEAQDLQTVSLSYISDDAQAERLEIIWDAEIGAIELDLDGWQNVGQGNADSAEILAAHLRVLRWRSATAADRDLLQAPFRAGIRLDAYQLLPLRKALRLPRVNLLIADDVGLGKTVEAVPLDLRPPNRDQPLPERTQYPLQTLRLDRRSRQNHRRCQARTSNVRFDPLATFRASC